VIGASNESTPLVLRCVGSHGTCQAVFAIFVRELRDLAAIERVMARESWTLGLGLLQLPGQIERVQVVNPICPRCSARMLGRGGAVASPNAHGTKHAPIFTSLGWKR
jgi:hypothetical protein